MHWLYLKYHLADLVNDIKMTGYNVCMCGLLCGIGEVCWGREKLWEEGVAKDIK